MEVGIACSAGDELIARQIAARLRCCAGADVSLESYDPGQILDALETMDGLLVMLLSAESTPAKFQLGDWEKLLKANDTRLACVLVPECRYPKLLEKQKFWRWQDPLTLRALNEWVMAFGERPSFRLARVEGFRGREAEMEELYRNLVDQAGQLALVNEWPGSGKTGLAQHFARLAEGQFQEIVWLDCARRRPLYPVDATKRTLLVLDDVMEDLKDLPQGRVSVLVTSRRAVKGLPLLAIEAGDYLTGATIKAGRRNLYSVDVHGRQGGIPLNADATLFRATASRSDGEFPESFVRHFSAHLLAEAEEALHWAIENDEALASRLVCRVFARMRDAGRVDEGLAFLANFRGYEAVREYCNSEMEGRAKHIVIGAQAGLFG